MGAGHVVPGSPCVQRKAGSEWRVGGYDRPLLPRSQPAAEAMDQAGNAIACSEY